MLRIYQSEPSAPGDRAAKAAQKQAVMQEFRDQYSRLKAGWGGFSGYDQWVLEANNASLGAQAAYDELVPAFEALFAREGGNWSAFYDAVRRLADLPAPQRIRALKTTGDTR